MTYRSCCQIVSRLVRGPVKFIRFPKVWFLLGCKIKICSSYCKKTGQGQWYQSGKDTELPDWVTCEGNLKNENNLKNLKGESMYQETETSFAKNWTWERTLCIWRIGNVSVQVEKNLIYEVAEFTNQIM